MCVVPRAEARSATRSRSPRATSRSIAARRSSRSACSPRSSWGLLVARAPRRPRGAGLGARGARARPARGRVRGKPDRPHGGRGAGQRRNRPLRRRRHPVALGRPPPTAASWGLGSRIDALGGMRRRAGGDHGSRCPRKRARRREPAQQRQRLFGAAGEDKLSHFAVRQPLARVGVNDLNRTVLPKSRMSINWRLVLPPETGMTVAPSLSAP